jgi:peptide deformylase
MPSRRRSLPIVRLGNPILRRVAREVSLQELLRRDTQILIERMLATMQRADGVGLAAPQVGAGIRLFVWGDEPDFPRRAVVNPILTPTSDEIVEGWEGCLSLPGLRGRVPRSRAVRLTGLDPRGETLELELVDYEARVAQHELDHLDGIVFLDRMADLSSLGYDEELEDEDGA